MKKLIEFFKGIAPTIFAGVCLAASLVLTKILKIEIPLYLDPSWIPIIICGIPLLHLAIKRIIKNKGISKISSAFLISIAMIAAILIKDVFAAGEIAFIMALGEILEDKTTDKAKKGLKNLIELSPVKGRILKDGKEELIDAEKIQIGDIIRVLPGEKIPVDGEIIFGESSIDQSIMTGESLSVDKTVGEQVFCGTTNLHGSIDVKVLKSNTETSLYRLIKLVEEAEKQKAPIHRIADRWASYLVPLAMIIAIIAGIIKWDVTVAVTVLVVFCPCALVLATPTSIMAAIGQATKHGIIIKSGEALEKLGSVDTFAFDKTGTLTHGNIKVDTVLVFDEKLSENEFISLVASAESKSEHPLGKAISEYAKEKNICFHSVEAFKSYSGKGVEALINGKQIICGNERFIAENKIEIPSIFSKEYEEGKNYGMACVIVAIDKKAIGVIFLSDEIKEEVSTTIEKMRKLNVETCILTGDNEKSANYFSSQTGIKNIYANLLPENKVSIIEQLKKDGKKVCMVGDGVNDAPSLKTADVGIAMASIGSDISVDAADVVLLNDDISKIPYLKKLSTETSKTIKLSIFLSLFINFVSIILSISEILTPTTGALVHNAGSLFVILIAAKLYDKKFDF